MKTSKLIIITYLFLAFFLSCNSLSKEKIENKKQNKSELEVKLTHVNVKIEGMTCEIGCARLIQSKLYKTEGVTFANISFEEKNGNISYDSNKISEEEIKNAIEKIAGGDLYEVAEIDQVAVFTKNVNKVDL